MTYKGRVHKFGDNINTDEIIPARYLNTTDSAELARHCMEGARKNFAFTFVRRNSPSEAKGNFAFTFVRRNSPSEAKGNFARKVKAGDVIVAGKNFGCGSSREHAAIAIKACGISCVIAESFARIFFRNSINIGLPIIESHEASKKIRDRDLVRINTKLGIIRDLTKKESYRFEKFPPFMQRIVRSGGLMNSIRKRLE